MSGREVAGEKEGHDSGDSWTMARRERVTKLCGDEANLKELTVGLGACWRGARPCFVFGGEKRAWRTTSERERVWRGSSDRGGTGLRQGESEWGRRASLATWRALSTTPLARWREREGWQVGLGYQLVKFEIQIKFQTCNCWGQKWYLLNSKNYENLQAGRSEYLEQLSLWGQGAKNFLSKVMAGQSQFN